MNDQEIARRRDNADRPSRREKWRNRLVEKNLSLAQDVCRAYLVGKPTHLNMDEIYSSALEGLLKAAGRYKADSKIPFRQYAKHRVMGQIVDNLRAFDHHNARASVLSIGQIMSTPDGEREFDYFPINDKGPDDLASNEAYEYLTWGLDPRQQLILDQYFKQGLLLTELGRELGMTDSRVCQLKQDAIQEIREHIGALPA